MLAVLFGALSLTRVPSNLPRQEQRQQIDAWLQYYVYVYRRKHIYNDRFHVHISVYTQTRFHYHHVIHMFMFMFICSCDFTMRMLASLYNTYTHARLRLAQGPCDACRCRAPQIQHRTTRNAPVTATAARMPSAILPHIYEDFSIDFSFLVV